MERRESPGKFVRAFVIYTCSIMLTGAGAYPRLYLRFVDDSNLRNTFG